MDDTSTTSSGFGSTTTSSTPNVPEAKGLPIPPPLVALLCLAGGLALHALSSGPRTVFAHHILGLLIVAGGTGLCFYAAALFQARGTTKNPHGEASAFVA